MLCAASHTQLSRAHVPHVLNLRGALSKRISEKQVKANTPSIRLTAKCRAAAQHIHTAMHASVCGLPRAAEGGDLCVED